MKQYAEPEAGYDGWPNVDMLPRGWNRVARDLRYYSARFRRWICIPKGFLSDLLSVPWWARWLLPKGGPGRLAAILHDYLCEDGYLPADLRVYPELSSAEVHSMFEEALIVADNVKRWRRATLYYAVRVGGPRFQRVYPEGGA